MKIVLVCQIYNELETGCLQDFFAYNAQLFDDVVVYDDGSTDGSAAYCKQFTEHVILGVKNNFEKEKHHKSILLNYANKLSPDFVMFLDADEILALDRSSLELICRKLQNSGLDGYRANFLNLWRSPNYVRTDSLFDDFKPVKLWIHRGHLEPYHAISDGLHQAPEPDYVVSTDLCDQLVVVHTGFISIDRIIRKFFTYRSKGQKGRELLRFIDESEVTFRRVEDSMLPSGWQLANDPPAPISVKDYFIRLYELKENLIKPKVTVFSLIYRDTGWLKFVYSQFLKFTPLDDVEFYFVANDAEPHVIAYLRDNYIPFYEFNNTAEHKSEHYINNVYRAYNFGVSKAKGEQVLLLNSDMAFSNGWLDALLSHSTDGVCVASRLIEQGKLSTGIHGIEKNFGQSWEEYDEPGFTTFADHIALDKAEPGGLYMPLLVKKADFDSVGGYPEGNIEPGSDIFDPVIADPGVEVIAGDTVFIQKLESIGVKHITAFNSVVYHFQEGEKRSEGEVFVEEKDSKVGICNDQIKGINGEKVLWEHLLQLPNSVPLDYSIVEGKKSESFVRFVERRNIDLSMVLQNASFIPRLFPKVYTMVYLQDNLRAMGHPSIKQEINLQDAECLVTNTIDTAVSYPEYDFDICPIGVDDELFKPMGKSVLRERYGLGSNERVGIFVGALNEVKGWSEIKRIIESEPLIKWLIVSKYNEEYSHPNVTLFSKLSQNELVELLNAADFFILGSPVETQCLAAIEAALCNVPVVMKPVGVFATFSAEECASVGSIQLDLHSGVREVLAKLESFSPRETIQRKGLTLSGVSERWYELFVRNKIKALSREYRSNGSHQTEIGIISRVFYRLEVIYRFKVLKPILRRDTFYSVAEISVFIRDNLPAPIHRSLRLIWRLVKR